MYRRRGQLGIQSSVLFIAILLLVSCGSSTGSQQGTGNTAQVASTPTPTTPPQPTPTPLPKGIIGSWEIIPLHMNTAKGDQEGYSNVTVFFAVKNLGQDLIEWPRDDATFTMQGTVSGSNFNYSDRCEHGGELQPPAYYLQYQSCFAVPQTTSTLIFIATPNPNLQTSVSVIQWNAATEISGSTQKIQFPSSDTSNLKQLGEPISQSGIMDVVLLKVQLQRNCAPGAGNHWVLNFTMHLHNNYGKNVGGPYAIMVYDNQGNAYAPTPGFTNLGSALSPLADVPPGITHSTDDALDVSSFKEPPTCNAPTNISAWPTLPQGLRFLVALKALGTASPVWAVYDIGNPPQASDITLD